MGTTTATTPQMDQDHRGTVVVVDCGRVMLYRSRFDDNDEKVQYYGPDPPPHGACPEGAKWSK